MLLSCLWTCIQYFLWYQLPVSLKNTTFHPMIFKLYLHIDHSKKCNLVFYCSIPQFCIRNIIILLIFNIDVFTGFPTLGTFESRKLYKKEDSGLRNSFLHFHETFLKMLHFGTLLYFPYPSTYRNSETGFSSIWEININYSLLI